VEHSETSDNVLILGAKQTPFYKEYSGEFSALAAAWFSINYVQFFNVIT
jgi:hypothetical protein